MPKLDLDAVPKLERTAYPPPFDAAVRGRTNQQVSRAAGITEFAFNLIELAPGSWSSHRHWHEQDDEFVMVLEGEAVLVDDGGRAVLRAGDCAAFPKGAANAHHFVNESDRPARLLVVGSIGVKGPCHFPDADLAIDPAVAPGYLRKDGSIY